MTAHVLEKSLVLEGFFFSVYVLIYFQSASYGASAVGGVAARHSEGVDIVARTSAGRGRDQSVGSSSGLEEKYVNVYSSDSPMIVHAVFV